MALSVDWDCFSSVMIWFSPSGCGSHVVILLPLTICCASPHFVFTPRQKSRYSEGGRRTSTSGQIFTLIRTHQGTANPFLPSMASGFHNAQKLVSALFSLHGRVPFWQKWRGVGGFFVPARSSFLPRGGGFRKAVLRPVTSEQGWGETKRGKNIVNHNGLRRVPRRKIAALKFPNPVARHGGEKTTTGNKNVSGEGREKSENASTTNFKRSFPTFSGGCGGCPYQQNDADVVPERILHYSGRILPKNVR